MKNSWLFLAAIAALALAATPSSAGAPANNGAVSVSVSGTSGSAIGGMGYAYNTSDRTQYIGCAVYGQSGQEQVVCFAQDASGNSGMCQSNATTVANATLPYAAAALTSDAMIAFGYETVGGTPTCYEVVSYVYSNNQPK
jgi:hypothetical protein